MADKSLIDTAKDRYQRARDAYDTFRQQSIADTRFVLGDSDNQWQWPDDVYMARAQIAKKPCLTINVTAQHCNQIINAIRQNRPSCKVLPVDDDSDKRTAEIFAGLIRTIQNDSSADTAHDIAAEHAIYGGEGYWRVFTEYETPDSFDQVIKIGQIPNPLMVYIDPDSKEYDRSDAKWGFIFEDIPKTQAEEEYPDLNFSDWVEDKRGWVQKDTIRRAEYFYCDEVPDTLYLFSDGSTIAKSKLPEGVKVEELEVGGQKVKTIAGLPIVKERETKRKQWKWCMLVGGSEEPVDAKDWPGAFMPIVTTLGKEINVNGEIVRKGIVRDLKDSARMVNYSYSAAVETLALQNKVPYLAAVEAIEGYEDIWGAANLDNRAYLPWNAFGDDGNAIPQPQRQEPAVMPAAQVNMLQLSVEQMRAASGQQNANFGIRSEAQSGIGIQRLKAQGEIATFHFPDNLARALRYEGRILVDLIPKIYDTKRIVRILGIDGKQEAAMLNPDMEGAYQDAEELGEDDIKHIFNPLVGRYDVVIDTGPTYQTQRVEAQEALTQITQANPQLMQVAGDIIMRSFDFPQADALADRLQKTLPPGLQDQKGEEVPPQAQAAMAQMTQQIQAMEQAGTALQQQLIQAQQQLEQSKNSTEIDAARLQLDAQKIQIDQFKAETDRLKAEADAYAKQVEAERNRLDSERAAMESAQPKEQEVVQIEGLSEILQSINGLAQAQVQAEAMPKRKTMQIQAPSGAIYTGIIEEGAE